MGGGRGSDSYSLRMTAVRKNQAQTLLKKECIYI